MLPQKRDQDWWLARHHQILRNKAQLADCAEIVLVGDSIMHEWELEGYDAWQRYFKNRSVLNLGFAGDCTEHIQWRLENGELDNLQANHYVVLAGTNNAGHRKEAPTDIANGVIQIVETIRATIASHEHNPFSEKVNYPSTSLRVDQWASSV